VDPAHLRNIPVFSDLDDDELSKIASLAAEVSVPEGKELVREGDSHEATGGELTADHGDADWIASREEGTAESPAASHPAGSGDPTSDVSDTDEEPTVEVARHARRKGRSSVPSWDEIMFGPGD